MNTFVSIDVSLISLAFIKHIHNKKKYTLSFIIILFQISYYTCSTNLYN